MLAGSRVDLLYRSLAGGILLPFLRGLGLTPDHLTFGGLVLAVVAGLAAPWAPFAAGLALLGAGLCDSLDGTLARATGSPTRAGAFLDSTMDRYGEFFLLFGVWGRMWRLGFGAWGTACVLLALQGSIMVSYARARAEGLGKPLRGGVFERAERLLVMAAGLLASPWERRLGLGQGGALLLAAAVLALGANATAVNRLRRGHRALAGDLRGEE